MTETKSEWTLNTLKEYFDALIESNDKRYKQDSDNQKLAVKDALTASKELTAAAFAASEKAIVKAESAQSDYNTRSNEFRGQLDDQAKRLMPRNESDTRFNAQEDKISIQAKTIEALSTRITAMESKGRGANAMWGYVLGGIGLVALLVSIYEKIK